jgi:hypothetical protein
MASVMPSTITGVNPLRNVVRARGVEPPLQNVAVDDHRPRQLPIATPLFDGPGVDDGRTGRKL